MNARHDIADAYLVMANEWVEQGAVVRKQERQIQELTEQLERATRVVRNLEKRLSHYELEAFLKEGGQDG